MGTPTKRSELSDEEFTPSSNKLIRPPKIHLKKKRKVQSSVSAFFDRQKQQDAVISLLSSDDEDNADEQNTQTNEQANDTNPNENLKVESIKKQPEMIVLDDSDSDFDDGDNANNTDIDMTNTKQRDTTTTVKEHEKNGNPVETEEEVDELVSDSNDEDMYLRRPNPVTKDSVMIDKNSSNKNNNNKNSSLSLPPIQSTENQMDLQQHIPESDLEPEHAPEHAPEPETELQSGPEQHQEIESHHESKLTPTPEYPQQEQEQKELQASVSSTSPEPQDKSKPASQTEAHSEPLHESQSSTEPVTSEIEKQEEPESSRRLSLEGLKDPSLPPTNSLEYPTPLKSRDSVEIPSLTSLLPSEGTYLLKNVVIPQKRLLLRLQKKRSSTSNKNGPSTIDDNFKNNNENAHATNVAPTSISINATIKSTLTSQPSDDQLHENEKDKEDEKEKEDEDVVMTTEENAISKSPSSALGEEIANEKEKERDNLGKESKMLDSSAASTDSQTDHSLATTNSTSVDGIQMNHLDEIENADIMNKPSTTNSDMETDMAHKDNTTNAQNTSTESEYDTAKEEDCLSDNQIPDTSSIGGNKEESMATTSTLHNNIDAGSGTSESEEEEEQEISKNNNILRVPNGFIKESNISAMTSVPNGKDTTMAEVDGPLHPPVKRSSITPINPEAHIDTNIVENGIQIGQKPRRVQRRLQKTGYTYDIAMSYHNTPDPSEIHPEDPRRIFKIYHTLRETGLLSECQRINSRKATKNEILMVHNILHYRAMRGTSDYKKRSDYQLLESKYDSIYLNSSSFDSGLYAVGCLIELAEAVILNQIRNGFAIIRPPGHHAEADTPMGFCVFNNVAIATKHCMENLNVRRVLILDWDVHFGNGTQAIFSEDPNVLYVSLHRYEDAGFYPSDKKGSAKYTGHGKGRGKTVNIPWFCAGMTDADYLYAFRQIVIPIATEFDPELVIVSAGFDAAINDPIGLCKVTPAGYGQMTHLLKSLAHGKLVITLEGGYDLNSIAVSALACMEVLLGEAPDPIDPKLQPRQECLDVIEEVKKVQSRHWKCCKLNT